MRTIKHAACTLLISAIVIFCAHCYKNYHSTIIQDPNEYLRVNNYVSKQLTSSFSGLLPDSDIKMSEAAKYYYSYERALFGNPNFSIYLYNKIDPAGFITEKNRIDALSENFYHLNNLKTVYYVGDLTEAITLYTDKEIYDGLNICFELAIVDEETCVIEYLVASVHDNSEMKTPILQVVETIKKGPKTGDGSVS